MLWSMGSQRVGHDWATELNLVSKQVRLWLTSFAWGQALLRKTECSVLFQNSSFFSPLPEAGRDFSWIFTVGSWLSTWKWISQHSFWFFILFSFLFAVRTEWWLPSSLSEDPNFPLVNILLFSTGGTSFSIKKKKRVHCLVTNSFCLLITHVKMSLFRKNHFAEFRITGLWVFFLQYLKDVGPLLFVPNENMQSCILLFLYILCVIFF